MTFKTHKHLKLNRNSVLKPSKVLLKRNTFPSREHKHHSITREQSSDLLSLSSEYAWRNPGPTGPTGQAYHHDNKGEDLSSRMLLTFQWHGLQNAELFENSHEQNDYHSDGKQLHSLNTHDRGDLRLLARELLELLEVLMC